MIEQINNALDFFAHYVESKVGKTGLTVTVDVWRNGSEIVTGAAATEIGDGAYRYQLALASVNAEGWYLAIFKTATTTVDQRDIPSLWFVQKAGVENLDALVSSRSTIATIFAEVVPGAYAVGTAGQKIGLIGAGTVTLTQVLSADAATLTLVRGDDYLVVDNRHISITSGSWANLTGATEVRLTMRKRIEAAGGSSDSVLFTVTDVVASRVTGAGNQTVVFQFQDADTAVLIPGTATGKWDVQALLSNGDIITLATGLANVTEDQTRPA